MKSYNILICDDNKNLCEGLSAYLSDEKMMVVVVNNGKDAVEAVKNTDFDVVLLDIMLPDIDGYEVCRQIRRFSNVYIIMLSARTQELDRIYGIEVGADDYITKPFSSREVVTRIRRAMSRIHPNNDSSKITLAELTVFPETYQVFIKDEEIKLSSKEFSLLLYLISNQGKVLTRNQIMDAVWSSDFYGDTRVIDGIIRRLRKKIDVKDVHFTLETLYGIGYKIVEIKK